MDIAQKLKRINDRASKETFAFRFYKSGDTQQEGDHDRKFKDLVWFNNRNDQLSQGAAANTTQQDSSNVRMLC